MISYQSQVMVFVDSKLIDFVNPSSRTNNAAFLDAKKTVLMLTGLKSGKVDAGV